MSNKVLILGTRGIPNAYGGFEYFAEKLALFLADQGLDVYVACSKHQAFNAPQLNNVNLIYFEDFSSKAPTLGQFYYDFLGILYARKLDFNTVFHLGYTSSGIWSFLFPKQPKNIVNVDGLEWKRGKFGPLTQKFLKWSEQQVVKHADHLVADSPAIHDYLKSQYSKSSSYIAYGVDVVPSFNPSTLDKYEIKPYHYHLIIARLEPENNVEIILKGLSKETTTPVIVIGNTNTNHGKYLVAKYQHPHFRFLGAIFNTDLNDLRHFASHYWHGHSVGGTNPSLLQALACKANVIAHRNAFNENVGLNYIQYFSNEKEVNKLSILPHQPAAQEIENHLAQNYSWDSIVEQYLNLIEWIK